MTTRRQESRSLIGLWNAFVYVLVLVLALLVFSVWDEAGEKPPDPEWGKTVQFGCSIKQIDPPPGYSGGVTRVSLAVWTRYSLETEKPPGWQWQLGLWEVEEDGEDKMEKANRECAKWRLHTAKEICRAKDGEWKRGRCYAKEPKMSVKEEK